MRVLVLIDALENCSALYAYDGYVMQGVGHLGSLGVPAEHRTLARPVATDSPRGMITSGP